MLLVEILNEGDVVDLAQRRHQKWQGQEREEFSRKMKSGESVLHFSDVNIISDFIYGALLAAGAPADMITRLNPHLTAWITQQIAREMQKVGAYSLNKRIEVLADYIDQKGARHPGKRMKKILYNLVMWITHSEHMPKVKLAELDEKSLDQMVSAFKERRDRKSKFRVIKSSNAMVDLDGPEALTPEIDDRRDAGRERDGYSLPLPP